MPGLRGIWPRPQPARSCATQPRPREPRRVACAHRCSARARWRRATAGNTAGPASTAEAHAARRGLAAGGLKGQERALSARRSRFLGSPPGGRAKWIAVRRALLGMTPPRTLGRWCVGRAPKPSPATSPRIGRGPFARRERRHAVSCRAGRERGEGRQRTRDDAWPATKPPPNPNRRGLPLSVDRPAGAYSDASAAAGGAGAAEIWRSWRTGTTSWRSTWAQKGRSSSSPASVICRPAAVARKSASRSA